MAGSSVLRLQNCLNDVLNTYSPRVLIVDMSCVTSLDVTGLDAIATVHSDCVFKGTAFFLAGLRRDMTSQFLAAFPDTVSSAPAATARLTKPLILRQFTAIDKNKGGRGMSPQPTRRASSARRGVDVHDDSNDPDVEMQPLNSFDDRLRKLGLASKPLLAQERLDDLTRTIRNDDRNIVRFDLD